MTHFAAVSPFTRAPSSNRTLIGVAAAGGAIFIWALWIVGTRQAVTHALDPFAVGFLRFAVPALLLAPVWMRSGLRPRGISTGALVALMGSGAPFFVIVATAMHQATAAEVGPMLPGAMSLLVALGSILFFREKPGIARYAGFALILLSILVIGGRDMLAGSSGFRAHALLIAGAAMWASYTLAYKHSGLSSWVSAAVVAAWSALALAPLGLPALASSIRAGQGAAILQQALVQGVLSGVIAIYLYGVAVRRLGALGGAACVALVPALATVLAIPVLGEWPTPGAILGIVTTTLGVALASGATDLLRSGRAAPGEH